MSHEFLDTDKMALPAPAAGLGVWENVTVPDDGDERKAAVLGVGLEAVAERTTWLRHRVVTAEPFAVTIPSLTNSGATVGASNGFVMKKSFPLSVSVPAGSGGHVPAVIWVTPSTPYVIEGAFIALTSSVVCSAAPSYVGFELRLGTYVLVSGTLSSFGGGDTAPINGTTTNKSIYGIASADRGPLLDGSLANSGKDLVGAASEAGKFTAYYNGFGSPFFGGQVTLKVTHGAVSAITIATAFQVTIYGRSL